MNNASPTETARLHANNEHAKAAALIRAHKRGGVKWADIVTACTAANDAIRSAETAGADTLPAPFGSFFLK